MKQYFLITLIAGSVAFTGCQNKSGVDSEGKLSPDIIENPATADPEKSDDQKKLPVFEFEQDRHHFGIITQGENVSYSFKFTNTGNAPLLISSASATCGCTVPEYSKDPVPPGGTGFIDVTFNSSGKAGMVSKTVSIIANTIPNTKVLTISAEIQVPDQK